MIEVQWFFSGAGIMLAAVMAAAIISDHLERGSCAKENNVYDCKLVQTWVPLPPPPKD